MNRSEKNRLKLMFAAAAATGGLLATAPQAQAAFCSCLASTQITSIHESAFSRFGHRDQANWSPTDGWEVPLPSNETYGYRTGTNPTVFIDFRNNSSQSGSFWGSACRQSYTGNAVTCSQQLFTSIGANSNNHIALNVDSFHSSSNSVNDSYYAYWGPIPLLEIIPYGAATRQPRIPTGCSSGCPTNP